MAALKLELCLARRQGAGSPQKFPKINIPPLNKWLGRIKNMYKSEQYFESIYSYKKVLLLLTTSPYKMSLHTLLSFFLFFTLLFFFFFFFFFVFYVFNNNILRLQKNIKKTISMVL